jgi:DNA-binding HxlR family transcriptional regulator
MRSGKITSSGRGGPKRLYDDACGTALALEFVGERWSLLVIRELMFGPRRFGQIKANLPGISANVLAQRLDSLEAEGIVRRDTLPPPASVSVYDLTPWGRDAEVAIREIGRWAARSPRHDPLLFMSTASAMISLRTLIDLDRAAGLAMTVAFRFPDDAFVARLGKGALAIRRGDTDQPDVTFTGDTMALRRTLYVKEGVNAPGLLAVSGDPAAVQRFVDLFQLPEKIA